MKLSQLQRRANSGPSTDRSSPHAVTKSQGPFSTFAEQLFAIKLAYTSGSHGRVDPRLLEVNRRGQPAGSSEMIPADGGFLIQADFAAEIQRRMTLVGNIFRRCRQVPILSDSFKYPLYDEQSRATGSRWGGLRAYWINEADSLTKSKPRLLLSEVKTSKLIALVEATNELTQDAEAYAAQMTDAISEEMVFMTENAIINGQGSGAGPLGILNSPALIQVPKQSGQASGSVIYSNIEGVLASFWGKSFESENSVWLYHPSLLPQLASLSVVVGVAGGESKAWVWAASPEDNNMLAGIPALQSEYMQVPGAVMDLALLDLSRYLLVIREWMRTEISLHVLWLQDEACFRVIARIGGEPLDHTPVTPMNQVGTQKTSPFVCLGPR